MTKSREQSSETDIKTGPVTNVLEEKEESTETSQNPRHLLGVHLACLLKGIIYTLSHCLESCGTATAGQFHWFVNLVYFRTSDVSSVSQRVSAFRIATLWSLGFLSVASATISKRRKCQKLILQRAPRSARNTQRILVCPCFCTKARGLNGFAYVLVLERSSANLLYVLDPIAKGLARFRTRRRRGELGKQTDVSDHMNASSCLLICVPNTA